jgi:small subunit ribosomal protein S1
MTNNQETRTGENFGGETQAGEHQATEQQNEATAAQAEEMVKAGEAVASGSESAASEGSEQSPPSHDQAGAGGAAKAATESAQQPTVGEPTQSADAETRNTPPTGAQLSPNAPRTVKKPADMKPVETSDQSESAKSANQNEPAKAATQSALQAEPSGDFDFGAILDQFEAEQTIFHAGELVEGKVVGISDHGVLIDFGYKSEGLAPIEDFTSPDGEVAVKVGDPVEVVIRTIHTGDAPPQLSRTDALTRKAWSELEAAYREERPVIGKIVDKTKGGLKVELNGIEAFLPGSQIDSRPIRQLDTYIGEEIEARIIKFSRKRNNIVLSRKVITDEVINKQKSETLSNIDVGYIVDGTIKNLTEYGAFVDIGGIDGLLHVTDMSWGRLHHPSEMFKQGDHIQVKVLKLDRDKEKISLGYKQLLPDPWSTVTEVYHVNSRVRGKVSSVTDYGVFVELEPGVEGLVHVSEISWSKRSVSPKKMFQKGDDVDVQVLGVDTVEKRISLGMKQFQDNPWDTVDLRYPVGSKVHGRVRNITDFGAFVELEEGIDGLVHVSDITWAKKVKHPKELLKKDQEVDAIVTNIDKRGQRLSLSMKDLMPSAWETFIATHRPGDIVRGKVTRFTSFGVFVELGEGLEGLCHISELADQRVEKPEDVAQIGQEMDFKILRIEHEDQKIGLSHRAVGKDEGPVIDTKMYSSEAKSGMASLAELANINLGGAQPAKEKSKKKKERRAGGTETAPAPTEESSAEAGISDSSEEAAASPAESATESAPITPESSEASEQEAVAAGEAPAAQSDIQEEVAPESGESTESVEAAAESSAIDKTEAESESEAAEASTEIETPPAESASQPETETQEAAEESEKKSA